MSILQRRKSCSLSCIYRKKDVPLQLNSQQEQRLKTGDTGFVKN